MAVWNFEPNSSIQASFPSKNHSSGRTLFFSEGEVSDMEDESDDDDDAIIEKEI